MRMRSAAVLVAGPVLALVLVLGAGSPAGSQAGETPDAVFLVALETLGEERATKAGDDPARFDETMRILDWLVTSCPDTEAGISARAVRMRLNRELGREEDSAADGTRLVTSYPNSWQAGWAHRELAVPAVIRAYGALASEQEELYAQAFEDLESALVHLDLAIERAPLLTDEIWEPFAVALAVHPHSRVPRVEGFEATPVLWEATVYKALWEWESAAACYWQILDIAPGSHTANLARKHLDNLINAGLVAGNPSEAPPRLVSLRSAVEGERTRVFWDDVEREATVRGPHLMLSVAAGAGVARVNGAAVRLDEPASLVAGRLMVPRTLFKTLRQARVLPDPTGESLAALMPGSPGA
jgi:tetratricopeptide (TPR) repeat protein